jgi:hypothetical protein
MKNQSIITVCVLFIIANLAACAGPRTPRPASAAQVERIAAAFDTITDAFISAWFDKKDLQAIRALFTNDIVHHDPTFGAHVVGIEPVLSTAQELLVDYPSMRCNIKNRFIGLGDGILTYECWDFFLGAARFTQDNPVLEVDLLQTRGDRISYWTLFYGLDSLEEMGVHLSDEARPLLSSYGSAWSSGDPSIVGSIYAGDAVREDTILGELQNGSEAITSFAETFFARHPGAEWTPLHAFGEGSASIDLGGTFSVLAADPTGQSCQVLVAVVLQASGSRIVHEALYYDADSLTRCRWVQ